MNIGAIIDSLIGIKDRLRNELYDEQIDALNHSCNILSYNFHNFIEHEDAIGGAIKPKNYSSFEMTHIEECQNDNMDNSIIKYYIDGYSKDNDVGTVIVVVSLTEHYDIVIDWHHNGYRLNHSVLELVEKAKADIKEKIYG